MTSFNGLATTAPYTQMTFVFPETDSPETGSKSVSYQTISTGVAIPQQTRPIVNTQRRNKPEHISDLLLVVLDRYGIDANEFMAGLE